MWPKKGRNEQRDEYGAMGFGPPPFIGNIFTDELPENRTEAEVTQPQAQPQPAGQPEPESPQVAASAQAIGGRYETMNSALDGIALPSLDGSVANAPDDDKDEPAGEE